jgi:ATP-dependent DNA helicase DinG
MTASERFTASAAEILRDAIADAGGNEVFAAGSLDGEGLVAEITVGARGRKDEVLALAAYLDRGDVIIHNHPLRRSGAQPGGPVRRVLRGRTGCGLLTRRQRRRRGIRHRGARAAARPGGIGRGGAGRGPFPGREALEEDRRYEPRESQIALTRHITRAFNESFVLAAEAGTGVGKSYAYLLPALAWAARNGERVVVSTATINLQRQLMEKDLPVVLALFRKKLKAVLAKGRGNYLCRTRLLESPGRGRSSRGRRPSPAAHSRLGGGKPNRGSRGPFLLAG